MKKIFFYLLFFCLISKTLGAVPIVNDPLKIALGSRYLALGRAAVALADDVNAMFINPAGLIQINSFQITAMRANFLDDYTYTLVGAALPLPFGSVGIGYVSNFSEGIPKTIYVDGHILPDPNGTVFGGNDDCALVSLAVGFKPWVAVGANFKYYKQVIDNNSRAGQALDVGALIKLGHFISAFRDLKPFDEINLGLSLQNIIKPRLKWSFDDQTQEIGTRLRLGISARVLEKFTITADYGLAGRSTLHAGLEWWVSDQVALRVGADEGLSNLTVGIGLKTGGVAEKNNLGGHDFEFDYAYRRCETPLEGDGGHFFELTYLGPQKMVKKEFVPGTVPAEETKEGPVLRQPSIFYSAALQPAPVVPAPAPKFQPGFYGVERAMLFSGIPEEESEFKKVELKINYWPAKVRRGQRFSIKLAVPPELEVNKIKVEFKAGAEILLSRGKKTTEYEGGLIIPKTWLPGTYEAIINVIAANAFFEPKVVKFEVL